jgi:hypothetical protein
VFSLRLEDEDVCYDGDFRIDGLIVTVSFCLFRGRIVYAYPRKPDEIVIHAVSSQAHKSSAAKGSCENHDCSDTVQRPYLDNVRREIHRCFSGTATSPTQFQCLVEVVRVHTNRGATKPSPPAADRLYITNKIIRP